MKKIVLLSLLMLAGCSEKIDRVNINGKDGVDGKDGYSTVAKSTSSSDMCGEGISGTQVILALDLDRSLNFSSGDLVQTQFIVCNGTNGSNGTSCSVEKVGPVATLTCGNSTVVVNDGVPGSDGKSAYEIWLELGNEGTEAKFLDSLKGPKGDKGNTGTPGLSAYQIWINLGNSGTESQFTASLVGPQGPAGAPGITPSGIFITEFLNPCNNEFAHDEILMRMSNGKVVAVYDGGPNEDRLTFLVPGTEYRTTDRNTNNQCRFKITQNGDLTNQKLCQGNSDNCTAVGSN